MYRLCTGALIGLLALVGTSSGEEVEWKAASPSNFPPESRTESTSAKPSSVTTIEPTAPVATLRRPVSGPSKSSRLNNTFLPSISAEPERLGPPSPVPPWERRPESLPSGSALRTLNLVSEEPWGFEPAPVDAGRRFYFRAEYLMWWTKLMRAPALGTTAALPPAPPPPPNVALPPGFGQIGFPGTTILFGNGPIGDPFHHGGRFSAGIWLDDCQTCGVDASYFFLGRNPDRFFASSPGFPVILRPFIQANPPFGQNSQIVAFPPGYTINGNVIPDQMGSLTVDNSTAMWGVEFNARESLCCRGGPNFGRRFDVFAGFRYLDLDDRLEIVENIILGANNVAGLPPGTSVVVNDRFSTHNQFYGGQLGVRWELRRGNWVADGRYSVALGGTQQTVIISGNQLVTPPAQATQVFNGGLLALPSNIGRFTRTEFSVAPELTLNLGYQVSPGMKVFMGYNGMFWSRVARAAEQIDPVLDISQIPNFNDPNNPPAPVFPLRPLVPFNQNDFWAQGIQVGVELKW